MSWLLFNQVNLLHQNREKKNPTWPPNHTRNLRSLLVSIFIIDNMNTFVYCNFYAYLIHFQSTKAFASYFFNLLGFDA